jgi:gamma-glutamyltranspeptidase/glutathione hydrolase
MVAASQPLAAQAGLRILQAGGNAVDAVVAAAATLAVVEPMMTGPGGDLFALVWMAGSGRLEGLNASGFSPRAVDLEFFAGRGLAEIPLTGPFSVTTPGSVDGWAALLERHGRMSLADVLQPAIGYAENGYPVSEIIAADWEAAGALHAGDPDFAEVYLPGGRAPRTGEVFFNRPLARTLRQIAAGGRDAFYRGPAGAKMVERLHSAGWPMAADDLARQHAEWVAPIDTTYRGVQVYELPPNGQGMAVLEMLNILEGFDLGGLQHNSAAYLHLLLEAKKLAYADLYAWLADPARSALPVAEIISKEYAAGQRARIDPRRAAADVRSGIPAERLAGSGNTVYLTAVDRDRNAVSLINSIYNLFGSGIVVPGSGVILQNRGALFCLEPDHPNRIEGGKRPFHTIIPAMAFREGRPWLSFGVMGGDMQPQGQVQVLLNMIDFGMGVQQAGEAARVRHSPVFGVSLESGIGEETAAELLRIGHPVAPRPGAFGGYQAIQIDWEQGVLRGGSDPRKDGCAVAW